MTGIGLIFLILFLVALLAGVYFAAWCICGVQRSRKEGHYILDSEDQDVEQEIYGKKLYAGLGKSRHCMHCNRSVGLTASCRMYVDMVDEAKETYVKNQLDLDSVNENPTATALPESPAAPPAAAAVGEEEKPAPSAPEDNGTSSASTAGGGANADAGDQV